MSNVALKVYERPENIKGKQLRKNGDIPGIIYGEFLENSIPIKVNSKEIQQILRNNSSGSIIKVSFNDKNLNCVVKEVQKSLTRDILHVDLQYTKPEEIIKMRIPITCIGQKNLEIKRLVLETHNLYLDLQGKVEDIPEHIEIDVSDMNFEDKIFAEDIKIPESVILLTNPKALLAVVNN